MIRNFKALGLALAGLFAMSAGIASTASATAGILTTEGKSVVATGSQVDEHEFTLTDHPIGVGSFNGRCKKSTSTGPEPVKDGATTVRVHPVWTECIIGGLSATITTTGCDYVYHFGTPTGSGGLHVTTDIVCAAASVIKIISSACELTIGAQNGLMTSEVTNSGGRATAMDLLLHTSISGLTYTVVKDGVGCTLSGTGTFSKGDYTGVSRIKAHDYITGAAVGFTAHDIPVPTPPSEPIATAKQVGEHQLSFTDHLISGQPAAVKCKSAEFTGTEVMPEGLETVRVHPDYKECNAFGQPATITTTGCQYLFHLRVPTTGGRHVSTDLLCNAGSAIKIATAACEVTIGPQTDLTTSAVANSEAGMDPLLHTNIGGVHYTVTKDDAGCPLSGKGGFSQGDYIGTTAIRAHDAVTLESVGISVPDPGQIATAEQLGNHQLSFTDHKMGEGFADSKCKKATFTGTKATKGLEEIRVHPVYTECTAFGQPATITTTGCDYIFHTGGETGPEAWHATTDLACTGGSVTKIVTGTCEAFLKSQNALTTAEVTNSGTEANMDLLLHTNITGLKYTITKDNIGCPLSGTGTFSKGDYTGTTTVRAHDFITLEPVDITKN